MDKIPNVTSSVITTQNDRRFAHDLMNKCAKRHSHLSSATSASTCLSLFDNVFQFQFTTM